MTVISPARPRAALAISLGALLVAAAACSSPASSSSAATQSQAASQSAAESTAASASEGGGGPSVTISGTSSFGAAEVTVPAGEKLTVSNASSTAHTFTEGQNGAEVEDPRVNETLDPGTSVEVEFPEPGDYNVTCLFHSQMNMVVHVE